MHFYFPYLISLLSQNFSLDIEIFISKIGEYIPLFFIENIHLLELYIFAFPCQLALINMSRFIRKWFILGRSNEKHVLAL